MLGAGGQGAWARMWWATALAALCLVAPGCGGTTTGDAPSGQATASLRASAPGGDKATDRPYDVFVPSAYDGSTAVPLVLLLHGYSSSGTQMESIFRVQSVAEARGFLYVHPEGTRDSSGAQFWNATDGCCNADGAQVDDSAYLARIIDEIGADYRVDPSRVYLFGVSNGGFMAYRMACDHADVITAIASMAGASYLDPSSCTPSRPVSVLQVHGTADRTIPYDGGQLMGPAFPSAPGTVAQWAEHDGCGPDRADTGRHLDLASMLDGRETVVSAFDDCAEGTDVELWTVQGADHVFPFTSVLVPSVVDFLLEHDR